MVNNSIQFIDFLHIEAQGVVNKVLESFTTKRLQHVREILLKVHRIYDRSDFLTAINADVGICKYTSGTMFDRATALETFK